VKGRHILMAGGVVIAGWLALFGDKTPNGSVAAVVAPTKATAPAKASASVVAPETVAAVAPIAATSAASTTSTDSNPRKGKVKPEPTILVLLSRKELIGGASIANKTDTLFASQSWVPPPPPPVKPSAPPPPTAPAMPFTFIGKKLEDAVWEVYLTKGEQTFIVRDKSVIDATYRVEAIKPPTLTLMYLPLNQMQTLTIGGAD
jgi:hypothetical protein